MAGPLKVPMAVGTAPEFRTPLTVQGGSQTSPVQPRCSLFLSQDAEGLAGCPGWGPSTPTSLAPALPLWRSLAEYGGQGTGSGRQMLGAHGLRGPHPTSLCLWLSFCTWRRVEWSLVPLLLESCDCVSWAVPWSPSSVLAHLSVGQL